MHIIAPKTGKRPSRTQSKKTSQVNKAFSHDVTAAILVYQDNPVGEESFSYANDFFWFKTFAYLA